MCTPQGVWSLVISSLKSLKTKSSGHLFYRLPLKCANKFETNHVINNRMTNRRKNQPSTKYHLFNCLCLGVKDKRSTFAIRVILKSHSDSWFSCTLSIKRSKWRKNQFELHFMILDQTLPECVEFGVWAFVFFSSLFLFSSLYFFCLSYNTQREFSMYIHTVLFCFLQTTKSFHKCEYFEYLFLEFREEGISACNI